MTQEPTYNREPDGGKKADVFLAMSAVVNRQDLQAGIVERVKGISDFDELVDLTLSALSAPNTNGNPYYGLTARYAMSQANFHSESGRFHQLIEDDTSDCIEGLVYADLLKDAQPPEKLADVLEQISSHLTTNSRIMTLEHNKLLHKNQLLLKTFDLYQSEFVTKNIPDGVSIKNIVEKDAPAELLFQIAIDLAKKRSYKGDLGYDIDFFDVIEEYAFCDLMILYLTPISLISNLTEVKAILEERDSENALLLLDSIVEFQRLIIEDFSEGNFDRLLPLLAMVRNRQIFGISTLLKNETIDSENTESLVALVKLLSKKGSATPINGIKHRYNKLNTALQQSEFGLHVSFFMKHDDEKIDKEVLEVAELEANAQYIEISQDKRSLIKKRGLVLKNLSTISIVAEQLQIEDLTFRIPKNNDETIEVFIKNKDGLIYGLSLGINEKSNSPIESILRIYATQVLNAYDHKTGSYLHGSFVSPEEIVTTHTVGEFIDNIDPSPAEVTQTNVYEYLNGIGNRPLGGVLGKDGSEFVISCAIDHIDLLNSIDAQLLRLLSPLPISYQRETSRLLAAVHLGDSAQVVAKKLKNKKKKNNVVTSVDQNGIKTFKDLARSLGMEVTEEPVPEEEI